MQEQLVPEVKGLILAQVVDPANGFITFSQNGLEQSHLLEILKIMPRERELRDVAFDEFVRAMRQHYESFVTEACISGLLNLYRYEMLRCERSLIQYLCNCFAEIQRSGDPTVLLQGSNSPSSPELQQIALLEQKLNTLKQLKEQLAIAPSL